MPATAVSRLLQGFECPDSCDQGAQHELSKLQRWSWHGEKLSVVSIHGTATIGDDSRGHISV